MLHLLFSALWSPEKEMIFGQDQEPFCMDISTVCQKLGPACWSLTLFLRVRKQFCLI